MTFLKRYRRYLATFLTFLIVDSIVRPTIGFALTTGPHQQEYISFEEPNSSDMVNLLTGDFTYNMSLLDVPGPEGSFPIPLTYNAGIGLDQEASWAGLGWTLNVGAITRQINQYPDDASGEPQSVRNVNLKGVRGWTSNALGLGSIGWNTAVGNYGMLNLLGVIQVGYDRNGISSGGVLGIGVSGGHVGFNPAEFFQGVATIASYGLEGAATTAASSGKMVALGLIRDVGVGAAQSTLTTSSTPTINPASGYWSYNKKEEREDLFNTNYWIWLDQTRQENMYGLLNLDKTQVTAKGFYGEYVRTGSTSPYQDTPFWSYDYVNINGQGKKFLNIYGFYENNVGSSSDINYYLPQGVAYKDAQSAGTLATDNFIVKAPGISGSIQPYRFDIGSVCMPMAMTQYHIRYNAVPFASYKVPFIYSGTTSSSYLYNTGTNGTGSNFGLDFNCSDPHSKIIYCFGRTPSPDSTYQYGYWDLGTFTLTDPIFNTSQRVRSDVQANGYKISQSNHIEWLSNSEVRNAQAFNNGFMDYFTSTSSPTRNAFRSSYSFSGTSLFIPYSTTIAADGSMSVASPNIQKIQAGTVLSLNYTIYDSQYHWERDTLGTPLAIQNVTVQSVDIPNNTIRFNLPSAVTPYIGQYYRVLVTILTSAMQDNGIAGYSITKPNGLTYHFALPIYDYQNYTRVADKADPNNKFSEIRRQDPFANTWLLTGITGTDFVDRNSNGAIDENDWGYWVKFNYGKYAEDYQWRIPFSNEIIDSENSSFTHSQGVKQLYYLNSVETRSHVALFIKDNRSDGKDYVQQRGMLRLSEIALLQREDYKKLSSNWGLNNDSGSISSLWMSTNFYNASGGNLPVGDFLTQSAIKRIKFTFDYSLCPGTPNSAAPNQGKLTLKRLSIIGRNNFQVVPDYKFEYNTNNPTYNINQWDAWGMYNPQGTAAYNTHKASTNDGDGTAWSLNRITTPQGSKIDVVYERDRYSSVSEFPNLGQSSTFNFSTYANASQGINSFVTSDPNANFAVGDNLYLQGIVTGTCSSPSQPISSNFTTTALRVSSISVSGANKTITMDGYFGNTSCSGTISLNYNGSAQKRKADILGGGIRVGSVTISDQGQSQKTRYLYNNVDGTSSGVIAQEPGYARTASFDFYTLPGYPSMPVVYGMVSVLSGRLQDDNDFHTKAVYEFETPATGLISFNSNRVQYNGTVSGTTLGATLLSLNNQIADQTSRIGKLNSIKIYDASGLVSSTKLDYTNQLQNPGGVNQNQGIYSSSLIMQDRVMPNKPLLTSSTYKINRSTVVKYPYTLKTVTTQKDGAILKTDNLAWDFISGEVLESNTIGADGMGIKTVVQPAYLIYPQMGPKAIAITNKNLLNQSAAKYKYRIDGSGKIYGLVGAEATTWSNSWNNYRDFDGTSGFIEGSGIQASNVWRMNKKFIYKGTMQDVQPDGTLRIGNGNKFDFTLSSNPNWQQTAEMIRYDHFSLPIETRNSAINIYSVTKTDFYNKFILATASNANYFEFAYSGAEDGDNTSVFFGGEVARKNGTVISTPVHTGMSALALSNAQYGFVFKSTGLSTQRSYKASVWTSDPINGRIYYNNGTENILSPNISRPITLPNGSTWYRLDVVIPAGMSTIEVGVKTVSGTLPVYYDDFRFEPIDANVSCNVYNQATGNLEFVFGKDNTYKRFEYNNANRVIKTYVESITQGQVGEKLVSESRYDYKRFHVDQ